MADLVYYRYDDLRRSDGCIDECGEWVSGTSYTTVVLHTFQVSRKTPKGAWLVSGRFVLDGSGKRWAHATKELALESFIARKKRQALILESQLVGAKTALKIAEKGVDCHERSPFELT